MTGQRNIVFDIAKGIGIILVVFGHLRDFGVSQLGIAHSMVYLFHVSLFFYLSGLFFRPEKKVLPYILNKFKRLYVPFILVNIFYLILETLGGKPFPMNKIPEVLLGLDTIPSAGPSWFLVVLFRVTVLYKLIATLCGNRTWMLALVSCLLLLASRFLPGQYWIAQTFVALFFYNFGYISGSSVRLPARFSRTGNLAAFSLMAVAILFFLSKLNGLVSFAWGIYGNFALFLVGSVVGILLVLAVSSLISRVRSVAAALSEVGKYTLPILVLHFLPFWAILEMRDRIGIHLPQCIWAVSCLVAGITVPLLLAKLKNSISRH